MFGYLRGFAILSLIAVIAISWLAGLSFRSVAIEDLTRLVERNTNGHAQGYINTVWKNYRQVIVPLSQGDGSGLRNNPQVLQFAQDTARYFENMPLLRVNIYSADGVLLMTNNIDGGIILANNAASPDVAFVNDKLKEFSINSQMLDKSPLMANNTAAIIQTIVPIRLEAGKPSEGGIELLYDMRLVWDRLADFQIYGTGGVTAVFIMLLIILFLSSKKAEVIISKQYEANMELAATAAAAQAENQQKTQFLANVSHELRTPLNAIIGFSEIIKDEVIAGLDNRKYHDYIGDIHASGKHLLSLINDILDYSKAEAGKLELEVSEVNTCKIVQNCIRLVSNHAEAAKVRLTDAMPKESFVLVTDGKKFKQVVLNLLSNAVKFTPAGGEVRITGWHNIADDTYAFEVRDTGIGIAPKDISVALSPFGQVDNTLSRKYEGTGLGLPLTKKFVELMGGRFSLTSEVNVGTTVTFHLPREIVQREGMIIKQAN